MDDDEIYMEERQWDESMCGLF